MGWQPDQGDDRGTRPGPARDSGAASPDEPLPGRDPRLSGFAKDSEWDTCSPSAALAAVLEGAAGPEWRCPGATRDEMFGMLRQAQALESRAAAVKLGIVRSLIRDDDEPLPGGGYHGDLPEGWTKSLTHEVALALSVPAVSADKLMWAAWDLQARLPGTGELLAAGDLTYAKAKAVHEAFLLLSDEKAGRAEAMILPGLPGKTYGQVKRLAEQAALTVDPESAARRREHAERETSRVEMFREDSGAVALSGRDLPTDQALAAHARVCARAQQYKDSGAFPAGTRMDQFRVAAYLDLLRGNPAEARIASGDLGTVTRATGTETATTKNAEAPEARAGHTDDEAAPSSGTTGRAADSRNLSADGRVPGGDWHRSGGPDAGSRDGEPEGNGLSGSGPDGDGPDGDGPDGDGPDDEDPAEDQPGNDGPYGDGPGDGGSPGFPGNSGGSASVAPPRLADLVLPLATLLGLAERPGEGHALGPLDPDLCRVLAASAAASPHSVLCVTVTDPDGIAIGHGCARRVRDPSGTDPDPGASLPARANLTITAARLTELAATGPPGTPGEPCPPGRPAWSFARTSRTGPPGGFGTWTLTLPGGRQLTVALEPVPTFRCDHRHESRAYQPNDRLRHLVQIRDGECTFPACSRHARESDFEHATPYDRGGRTCACNAGARSRACHQVKQTKGWQVTQPRPGWHQWQTPSGRVYVQGPKRYPA